jgi:GNAT superfamily N-acetyltransferase
MPRVVPLHWEMFNSKVGLTDLAATAAVHELVLVGVHHILNDGRLALLRLALAPRRLVVLLVDDHLAAVERAVADEILNEGTIPVVLTTTGGLPRLALTGWLDPAPSRRLSPARREVLITIDACGFGPVTTNSFDGPAVVGRRARVQVREFTEADWPQVWVIVLEVVQARETFPYDPAMTEDQARSIWIERPPGCTVVAVESGRILGTAKMGPNRAGPGSHVSTASFMVAAGSRGRGVGTQLCGQALSWAKENGYTGMQFNAVAESNVSAVELYQRNGFRILGTVPRAFTHPTLGRVGLHLMYQEF